MYVKYRGIGEFDHKSIQVHGVLMVMGYDGRWWSSTGLHGIINKKTPI